MLYPKDNRVGLYVNQNSPDSADPVRIPPSRHPEQLKHNPGSAGADTVVRRDANCQAGSE